MSRRPRPDPLGASMGDGTKAIIYAAMTVLCIAGAVLYLTREPTSPWGRIYILLTLIWAGLAIHSIIRWKRGR